MKNISKKLISGFIMLTIVMTVIMPTIAFAADKDVDKVVKFYIEGDEYCEKDNTAQLEIKIKEDLEEDLKKELEEEELIITWESNDRTIATVDEEGLVRGVAEGEVTITATITDSLEEVEKIEHKMTIGTDGMVNNPNGEEPNGEETNGEGETNSALLTDISQVKLNRKIKFSGMLYKSKIFSFGSNDILKFVKEEGNIETEDAETSYTAKNEYTNQIALVTDIFLKKSKGMIGVAFIEDGKKIPTVGYIKFDECEIEEVGKYLIYDFSFDKGASLAIKIDGEVYNVDANGSVEMSDGAIVINGDVILLDEKSDINLITAGGGVTLNIKEPSVTGNGAVSIYNGKISVEGEASLELIENGISVSGEAKVNDKEIGTGAAEVTYDSTNIVNVNVTKASILSNDMTSFANQIIQTLITTIKNIITKLFATLLGGTV